ncbi:MAG: hypothetical protein MUC62_00250 [Candidatus Thermoplasmatota archaeon]|jgi:hypothetical protein|nr:hypothetical protein [Candidatus Thermoplasmatota archaeon]
MMMVLTGILLVPGKGRAPSIDPYEIPPGNPLWFPLDGLDAEGEVLHYTITFKRSQKDGDLQRPIDFILLERSIADQNPTIEIALQLGLVMKPNISERTVGEFKNDRDSQIMALFFNHLREGDTRDWDNASVNIRFDYYITGERKEESSPLIVIVLVVLAVMILILMVILLVRRLKRGKKDSVTFFSPETGPYYAVRALVDSRVFYLDPDQYSNLYSSGRLNEFEFLGTSPRVGGMIIPPEGQEAVLLEPQALPSIPLQEAFVTDELLMSDMTAQPVAVPMDWGVAAQAGSGPTDAEGGQGTGDTRDGSMAGTVDPAEGPSVPEAQGEGRAAFDPEAPSAIPVDGERTDPPSNSEPSKTS